MLPVVQTPQNTYSQSLVQAQTLTSQDIHADSAQESGAQVEPEVAIEVLPEALVEVPELLLFGMTRQQLMNINHHLHHLLDLKIISSNELYTPTQIFNLTVAGICSILTYPYQTSRSQIIKLHQILLLPALSTKQQMALCYEDVIRAYTTAKNKYDAYIYLELERFLTEVERDVGVDTLLRHAKLSRDRRLRFTFTIRGLSIIFAIAYVLSIRNTFFDDFGKVAPEVCILILNSFVFDQLVRYFIKAFRYLNKILNAKEVLFYQCHFDYRHVYFDAHPPCNDNRFYLSLIKENIVPAQAFDQKVFTPLQLFNLQQPSVQLALRNPWFMKLSDLLKLNRKITPKEAFLLSNPKLYEVGFGLPIFYPSWQNILYPVTDLNFQIINSTQPDFLIEKNREIVLFRRRMNALAVLFCMILSLLALMKCSQSKICHKLNWLLYGVLEVISTGLLYFMAWSINAILYLLGKKTPKTSSHSYRLVTDENQFVVDSLESASLFDARSTYILQSGGFFFKDKLKVDEQSSPILDDVDLYPAIPALLRIDRRSHPINS